MEGNYNNTRDYMYPNYGGTISRDSDESDNDQSTSGDILQNFPYLRQGLNFGSNAQSTASSTHQDSLSSMIDYNKTAEFQQGFPQLSSSHGIQGVRNSNVQPFQSYVDPSQSHHLHQGVLPSVSTFTSALPQASISSQFRSAIPDTCDVQGSNTSSFTPKNYGYHASPNNNDNQSQQTSALPAFQSLTSMTSISSADPMRSIYSSSYGGGSLHGLSSDNNTSNNSHQFDTATLTQPSNYASSLSAPSFSREPSPSNNFYNLVNHAAKMSPVQVPHGKQFDKLKEAADTVLFNENCRNKGSDSSNLKPTSTVKFYLKGRLFKSKLSNHSPRMCDLVDMVDSFNDCGLTETSSQGNINLSKPKVGGNQAHGITTKTKDETTYKEPSLAEIRASVDNISKIRETIENPANISSDSIKEEREEADEESMQGFSLGGEGTMHESWYSEAIKRYGDIANDEPSNIIKGGRSDPDNPFAITSPSFSASAARALMVTTNSSTATTVRISIMSIGSRKKLLPNIVSSQAAQGGLVSIVNPADMDLESSADSANDPEVKSEKTSIMSKLKRDRQDKKDQQDDELDTEIDRLDVDITIDDDQFVGEGSRKGWRCKICPKSYTTKHNLLAHILDHSNIKPHLCLVCGKYFKQLSHLNTHMLTHDQVKPYKCGQCGKGFTQISHMKRHETVHLTKKPYICDICKRGFAYPSELRIHRDKHIFGKEKCTDCDMEFTTLEELKEHMTKEKHGDDLTCKHCHKVFKFPCQLRDHMMSHDGARPFICTECGMDFMKEHHLKAHLFTHTGLRPYACPHCQRAFNQKANMVRHMLIHDSERAFKCEICSKTFTQPQTLKAHMVVHSDKKPYSCRYCGKQFGRQHNLQGHLHMHMDSKPYVCSICQSSFTLKGNLNRHKKVKHGLNESTENMEEDAVKFLSSLSDRTRDCEEQDADINDEAGTPDGKSGKKARKSTPKKHFKQKMVGDENGDEEETENLSDTEDDYSNLISYSDEERENEERLSKYFIKTEDDEDGGSPRKEKGSVLLKNKENDENEETENDTQVDGLLNQGEKVIQKKLDSSVIHATPEKRSVRKRKKKALDEDFLDYNDDIDDENELCEPLKKSAKHKGAKLDTIIAAKFKNV